VNNSRTTKKIVGAAILGAAIVGGTAAYAYPPNTSMTASVTSAPASPSGSMLTVTVNNSNPDCEIKFDVNEVKVIEPAGHAVTFTRVFNIKSERGRHSITVKTLGCGGLNKESAKTSFQLLKPHIDTKSSIKAGSKFTVTVKDFPPNAPFTLVATKAGGPPPAPISWPGTTNSKGLGKVKIQLPSAGTWSLVASAGGVSNSVNILVK
jgi:hypothetical protein